MGAGQSRNIESAKHGFAITPDLSGTIHGYTGDTLEAELLDCLNMDAWPRKVDQVKSYVGMSRVRSADGLFIVSNARSTAYSPPASLTSTGFGFDTAAGHPGHGVTPLKTVTRGPQEAPSSMLRRTTRTLAFGNLETQILDEKHYNFHSHSLFQIASQ